MEGLTMFKEYTRVLLLSLITLSFLQYSDVDIILYGITDISRGNAYEKYVYFGFSANKVFLFILFYKKMNIFGRDDFKAY